MAWSTSGIYPVKVQRAPKKTWEGKATKSPSGERCRHVHKWPPASGLLAEDAKWVGQRGLPLKPESKVGFQAQRPGAKASESAPAHGARRLLAVVWVPTLALWGRKSPWRSLPRGPCRVCTNRPAAP